MKKFKIHFPERFDKKQSTLEQENKIKAILKSTSNGILSKIIIFLYQYQPCSVTELKTLLTNYYGIPVDRAYMYKYIKDLSDLGLVSFHGSSFACSIPQNKNNEIIKSIKEKHKEFLSNIPSQFQKNFQNVQYYYTTDFSEKFLPWCAEVINFEISPLSDKLGDREND